MKILFDNRDLLIRNHTCTAVMKRKKSKKMEITVSIIGPSCNYQTDANMLILANVDANIPCIPTVWNLLFLLQIQ